ncbi:MAG: helix-turn-helix domain-containing protein [Burkholderiales bacterium]|nr:helix-turn-helix domain-containing protein [Burkholderiales bacterium]
MSDPTGAGSSAGTAALTAGGLLRQARQAQGLHIAALAAAIKVTPRKLELLESDQFDQLPDATFTRALAQTVCRTLKVDAGPVLALMPPPRGHRLEEISEGLNTPFRERPGRLEPGDWVSFASPLVWVAGLLVLAALVVYFMPASWVPAARERLSSEPGVAVPATVTEAASAAVVVAPAASAVVETLLPPLAAEPAASAGVAEMPANPLEAVPVGVLQVHADERSWVEVTDARGRSLISRLVEAGEDVGLDGVMPLKVRIGNAGATKVVFRGQPLELGAFTRDNVARLELK